MMMMNNSGKNLHTSAPLLGLALRMRSELRSAHVRVSAVLGQGKQSTCNLSVDFRFLKPFKLVSLTLSRNRKEANFTQITAKSVNSTRSHVKA